MLKKLSTRKRPSCLLVLGAALVLAAVAAALYASSTPYNDAGTARTGETKRREFTVTPSDILRVGSAAVSGLLSPSRSNAAELGTLLAWQRQIQAHEFKRFSQNGEDGVIQYIFANVGVTDTFFVEFGTESGSETNTRYLREEKGWRGLLMDGGHENPSINLHRELIYPAKIVQLFEKYEVPKQFDLLSVDIDTFDLWVWRKLLYAGYRARVVVVEFNRNFEPGCFATFPDPTGTKPHVWGGSEGGSGVEDMVMGASLDAMDLLARQHGYVDSVMWLPFPEPFGDDKEMLRKAFEKGKKACEDIKREIFKKAFNDTHIDLEFEAVFFPYLLVGKKNYSARLCTMTSSEWKSQRQF